MTRKVLVPMDVHNAFRECPEDDVTSVRNTNPRVHPFLVPLLAALNTKRPAWTFLCEGFGEYNPATHAYHYDRVTIMDDGEALGKVWRITDWRNKSEKFAFDNTRLKNKRERGDHNETKDVKKATKMILENMYATTPQEFMGAARATSSSKLGSALYKYHQSYDTTKRTLVPVMEKFVLDHPEALKAHSPQVADIVDTLLTQRVELAMARGIQTLVDNEKTTLLVERGSKVYVLGAAEQVIKSGRLDTAPDHFKQVIGVLKLAPEGTLIPDLGFRAADNIYVAFNKEETDDQGTS